jgi:hypothetical protein
MSKENELAQYYESLTRSIEQHFGKEVTELFIHGVFSYSEKNMNYLKALIHLGSTEADEKCITRLEGVDSLVIASFVCEGPHIALILDPLDLWRNPVVLDAHP